MIATIELALRASARLPVPTHSAGEAAGAARRVLARREFREPAEPLLARLRDRAVDLLGRALAALFEQAGGSLLGWVVVALVVGAFVVAVARLAGGVRRDPGAERGGHDLGRAAVDWRAEAAAREAAGDWRGALRCRYRSLVADLAARGLVEEIPGRTAGEYRAAVARAAPGASVPFDAATRLFEDVWYGNAAAGAGDTARFAGLERDVLARAAR